MPMDGLMTGLIARELNGVLAGGRIDRISQPERDTVILTIRAGNANHSLLLCASAGNARAHLTEIKYPNPLEPPVLCMLMRKQLLGGRILGIRQVDGDRILHIDIDVIGELGDRESRRLVLEIMGKHSNLMLLNGEGRILESAHHVSLDMSRVRQIQPGMTYMPPPAQDRLDPGTLTGETLRQRLEKLPQRPFEKRLAAAVRGLSAASARELSLRALGPGMEEPETAEALSACADRLADLLHRVPDMTDPRVETDENGDPADVLPFPFISGNLSLQRPYPTLSRALEAYFGGRDRQDRLRQKSASMVRLLKTHLDRCEKKLALQEEELAGAARMEEYRIMGEVLNANLFALRKGPESVTLPNWYDPAGGDITIPLDARLTPSQNAQRYFKKYQKARSARQAAAEQKEKTLREMELLETALLDLEKCVEESELEEIRDELVRLGYMKKNTNRRQQRSLPQSKPIRTVTRDGFEILVGKNAVQNDRITQSAGPEDVWLHAKDMPGSHVVVRGGKDIPQEALKQAAMLAAWYSRGKGAMVPVDYTRRKYVKKPAGAAPGKVVYTHQKTAYITVSEKEIRALLREE